MARKQSDFVTRARAALERDYQRYIQKRTGKETNMARKQESDSVSFAGLPLISVMSKRATQTAKDLLEELEMHEFVLDDEGKSIKREDRVKQIKEELAELQRDFSLPGFRFGGLCFTEKQCEGRRTLDKALLMERGGVTAEQIELGMKQGESYTHRTFKKILAE